MDPNASLEEKVNRLCDRAEITDLIGKYSYGMDCRDFEMYSSILADEITVDITESEEFKAELPKVPRERWVKLVEAFFVDLPGSQHLKFPVSFEFNGDRAVVISILQGKHWMPTSTGGPLQTMVGYYRDEFVRTPDGWRLCGFKEELHWNEGNSHVLDHNMKNLWEAGNAAGEG